jgi:uncharacterized DUF497 family protein
MCPVPWLLYVLNCYYAMGFVWDENKNRTNFSKHGIAFATAAKVFDDPRALSFPERLWRVNNAERALDGQAGSRDAVGSAHDIRRRTRGDYSDYSTARERRDYEEAAY